MEGKPLWLAGALAVIALCGIWFFAGKNGIEYETATVERQAIVQEVSANGNVEPLTEIELHFRGSGRLMSRPVRAGDVVEMGDTLAVQDEAQLRAQLAEMQAGVDVQRARLEQLLAGASAESVQLSESAVAGARDALAKALRDAHTRADDAVRAKADIVFIDPLVPNPQLKFSVSDLIVEGRPEKQRLVVENALRAWSGELARLDGGDPAALVASAQGHLREVMTFLDAVAYALNTDIEGIDEATIETWKAGVSTGRANVNAGAAALAVASDAYQGARGSFAVTTASARPEDRALVEAQIRQAEAGMQRIQAALEETAILAPVPGTITRARGEVGEIIGPETAVVSLMPDGGLQVRLNVSEGNIVNIEVGQKARITLDAFQSAEWVGTVLEVEPAETVVGGAVYYETVVAFDAPDARIRRGMSANVWIQTAENAQALVVPASAIMPRGGKSYIRVLIGTKPEEREVQLGLSSSDGKVEIVSGLSEGENVILGERS